MPASSGPRDENEAVSGAGTSSTIVDCAIAAVAEPPLLAIYDLIASPLAATMCTLGTEWKSASVDVAPAGSLNSSMPAPPASATARLLSTSAMAPRLQSTILPVTMAAFSAPGTHSSALPAVAPAAGTATASTSCVLPSAVANEAPV